MGTGNAGFQGQVNINTSGTISSKTDGNSIGGVQSASIETSFSTLDITDFDDTGMNNLQGLEDCTINIEVVEEPDDAGQTDLEIEFNDANETDIAFWPSSNSLGITCSCILTETSHEVEVDSPDTTSYTALISDGNGFSVLT